MFTTTIEADFLFNSSVRYFFKRKTFVYGRKIKENWFDCKDLFKQKGNMFSFHVQIVTKKN